MFPNASDHTSLAPLAPDAATIYFALVDNKNDDLNIKSYRSGLVSQYLRSARREKINALVIQSECKPSVERIQTLISSAALLRSDSLGPPQLADSRKGTTPAPRYDIVALVPYVSRFVRVHTYVYTYIHKYILTCVYTYALNVCKE